MARNATATMVCSWRSHESRQDEGGKDESNCSWFIPDPVSLLSSVLSNFIVRSNFARVNLRSDACPLIAVLSWSARTILHGHQGFFPVQCKASASPK